MEQLRLQLISVILLSITLFCVVTARTKISDIEISLFVDLTVDDGMDFNRSEFGNKSNVRTFHQIRDDIDANLDNGKLL